MKVLFRLLIVLIPSVACAQPDSANGRQSVDIISSYKPNMRSVAKINFSAAQLKGDTSRAIRPYEVPSQNLYYAYRPIALKPLAFETDLQTDEGARNFVKAGIGNYSTPYLRAGFGYGDGAEYLANGYVGYTTSSGKIKFQDFSRFEAKASGSRFFKGHEWYGSAGFRKDDYLLYGYDHVKYPDVEKKSVRNYQQEFFVSSGIHNTDPGTDGFRYNPNLGYSSFNIRDKVSESAFMAEIPVEKNFYEKFAAGLTFYTSLVSIRQQFYDTAGQRYEATENNNIVRITGTAGFKIKPFSFHLGLGPVWDGGKLSWLPDITIDADVLPKFSLQAGWVGRVVQNTTRNMTRLNPYYDPQVFLPNTRETEFFGGIKGGVGKHFSFSGKASWISYKNLLFFINDPDSAGKGMTVSPESSAGNFRISGSISYVDKEKFSLTGSVALNGYTGLTQNKKPWHTLPLEITGCIRWKPLKKLTITSDLWVFTGSSYLSRVNQEDYKLKGGLDMSLGAEYAINKKISAWLDLNNIFADKYQRWNEFPVYGINFLGGVLIRF